ncbi:MAG: thioesterase family protein [Mycobacteriales bacterium]
MLRHSTTVTPEDIRPLAADVDPTAPGYGEHLGFDRILRRCGLAWMAFLDEVGGFGDGVIVPRLEVDYLREVHVGTLDVDVTLLSVGRTSFRLRLDVSQDGEQAAAVEVVLVQFGYVERTPIPLSPSQRAALEQHLAAPVT